MMDQHSHLALLMLRVPLSQHRMTKKGRESLFDAFLHTCSWTKVYYGWRPNLPDESDNHLVELAVAGGAEVIVTHNIKDFNRAELTFPGLQVVTPRVLLKEEK